MVSQRALLCVAGAFASQFALGFTSMWGSIVLYGYSYLRINDVNLTLTELLMIFPVTMITAAMSMQLACFLMDYLSHKVLLFLGGIIYLISLFSATFANEFIPFMILFSITAGIGFGIMFISPLKLAWEYFPNNRGTVSGIINGGFSIGAIFFTFFT